VEGSIGFEGLLDTEGGPDRLFDIPTAEEEEEDRWPMPKRSRQPVLKYPSKAKLQQLWDKHDYNGNGLLSQSEAKEVLQELWPALAKNSRVCDLLLRMAYKACDDGDGDGLVDRKEFPVMLEHVRYFNRMYGTFSGIDQSGDGILDVNEFIKGCKTLHIGITDEDAEKEFKLIDADGGGIVTFLEFCGWVAKNKIAFQGSAQVETAAVAKFRTSRASKRGTGATEGESAALGTKGEQAIQLVLTKQAGRQEHSVCWSCGQVGHVRTHCPNQDDETQLSSPTISAELGLGTTWNRRKLIKKHQDAFAKETARECAALHSIADERASVTP
jgi:Ca2+-binding EF-hand superfamily protein